MHRRPPHQSRAQAHAPTHAPGGTPTRTQAPQAQPVTPTRRQSAPRSQNPPPGPTPEQCGPPGWQPTSAGTGIPSSAACRRQRNSIQESPIPHPGQGRQPQRRTPQETHPQGTPRCPRPILPPHANNKTTSRTESGPPPTLGDGADQRSPERLI